ncbi:MAG: transposase, partial [Myxococcales bacterium]|nr:transposase [Myxococcales bacterium]
GIPLSIVADGANRHDVKLLSETLESIVINSPETKDVPQNLCMDAGYVGHSDEVIEHGYTPHIRPRGEEKSEKERNPNFKARRWIVEVVHS